MTLTDLNSVKRAEITPGKQPIRVFNAALRGLTHHPDHDVGEASDPDGGGEEGDHEPSLPAPLGTVWDGEEEQQRQRPHQQPLEFVTDARWRITQLGLVEERPIDLTVMFLVWGRKPAYPERTHTCTGNENYMQNTT